MKIGGDNYQIYSMKLILIRSLPHKTITIHCAPKLVQSKKVDINYV